MFEHTLLTPLATMKPTIVAIPTAATINQGTLYMGLHDCDRSDGFTYFFTACVSKCCLVDANGSSNACTDR